MAKTKIENNKLKHKQRLYPMLALYEVVKYLCLEMGIRVLYINEIMPQVYQMTETLGPYSMPTVQYGDSIPSNKLTRAIMLLI